MMPHDTYRLAIIVHEERIAAARTPRGDIASVRVSCFHLPGWATRISAWLQAAPRMQQAPKAPEPAQ